MFWSQPSSIRKMPNNYLESHGSDRADFHLGISSNNSCAYKHLTKITTILHSLAIQNGEKTPSNTHNPCQEKHFQKGLHNISQTSSQIPFLITHKKHFS